MKVIFTFLIAVLFSSTALLQTIPYQYGWPRQATTDFGLYNNSPAVWDMNNDGDLNVSVTEPIVTSGMQPSVITWRSNGTYLPGYPAYFPFGTLQSSGSIEISAMGDITGDGFSELAFGDENGRILVFKHNGEQAAGSPYNVGFSKTTTVPALADLTNDGKLEIIITSYERDSPNGNAQLHVLSWSNGAFSQLPGFPVDFEYGSQSSPVVGDINNDGELNIVFVSSGRLADSTYAKLHVLDLLARPLAGFPVELSPSSLGATPALYDINRDGRLEILLRAQPTSTGIHGIYAYNWQGEIMPNFPFLLPWGHPFAHVAIADMTGDGEPEFAFGGVRAVDSGHVFVWDIEGNMLPGFPQPIFATWVDGNVAMGDVSGDGLADVVVPTSKGFLYAFNYQGQIVPGFPLEAENVHVVKGFQTSPTLVDIDGDGDLEIFAGSLNKRVYGYDTPGIANDNVWSTFKGNAQRTGGMLKGFQPTLINDEHIASTFQLEQNYPNPFNPSTRINYVLPQASYVTIKVYNMLGQEIKTLVSEFKEAGMYEVNFNAAGLTSGVYIYKMEAENFIRIKKMTLLK